MGRVRRQRRSRHHQTADPRAPARRGIAGRGVLADIGRHYERVGKRIDFTKAESIPLEDLEATLAHQRSKLRTGDILLIRIGWTEFYLGASTELKEQLANDTVVP